MAPELTGEELVEAVPEIAGVARVSGSELTIDEVVALSEEVKRRPDGSP